MSRNEHGAYGPRYEVSTSAPVAGGCEAGPPHTGVEHPLASAPHVWHDRARTQRPTPSFPALLTLLAVLLAALSMFWPTHRFRQSIGPEGSDELITSFWIHGAITTGVNQTGTTVIRPIGLVLFILLMLGAGGAALAAWYGRSVRSDALGQLGVAVFAGAMTIPSFMALSARVDAAAQEVELEYAAGVWLGIAGAVVALLASVLFFTQIGRRTPRRVHD